MPAMVYHVPFALSEDPRAASALRPVKMLAAFREAGYEVRLISGTAKERRLQIRDLKKAVKKGLVLDFVYSEAATIPTSFTEPKHFPLVPFLDAGFFRFLSRRNVPIGLFYRDVYWAFPEYRSRVSAPVALFMRTLYRWDLSVYNRYVDVLFLPSLEMFAEIPGRLKPYPVALPPGAQQQSSEKKYLPGVPLELLYVGGVYPGHYNITELLKAIKNTENVNLTVCTPEESWLEHASEYQEVIDEKAITIVHRHSQDLADLYERADLAMICVEPNDYWQFAVPVKMYEYLGHGKGIVVSAGTKAAEIVAEAEAGWVVNNRSNEIAELLERLSNQPAEIAAVQQKAIAAGSQNTWLARAKQAASALSVSNFN